MGVPANTAAFIYNITNTRVSCRFGEIDEIKYIHKGVPQGSVLSPILYNIYVGDLNSNTNSKIKTLQYADDIVIYTDEYPVNKGLALLKSDLSEKSKYLHSLGLDISTNKTQLCVFSHKNKENTSRNYNGACPV